MQHCAFKAPGASAAQAQRFMWDMDAGVIEVDTWHCLRAMVYDFGNHFVAFGLLRTLERLLRLA